METTMLYEAKKAMKTSLKHRNQVSFDNMLRHGMSYHLDQYIKTGIMLAELKTSNDVTLWKKR